MAYSNLKRRLKRIEEKRRQSTGEVEIKVYFADEPQPPPDPDDIIIHVKFTDPGEEEE